MTETLPIPVLWLGKQIFRSNYIPREFSFLCAAPIYPVWNSYPGGFPRKWLTDYPGYWKPDQVQNRIEEKNQVSDIHF